MRHNPNGHYTAQGLGRGSRGRLIKTGIRTITLYLLHRAGVDNFVLNQRSITLYLHRAGSGTRRARTASAGSPPTKNPIPINIIIIYDKLNCHNKMNSLIIFLMLLLILFSFPLFLFSRDHLRLILKVLRL